MNKYSIQGNRTIHAEHDAINKLPIIKNKKKLKKINILIIKTSPTGLLGNSKPCYHCIQKMLHLLPKRGYKMDDVYYTDKEGMIQKIKFNKLVHEKDVHISSYYRHSNFKMK